MEHLQNTGEKQASENFLDVSAIQLRHLSPHGSPGLIWLMWLARRVSSSPLTAPRVSLPKPHPPSKGTTVSVGEDHPSVKGIRAAVLRF